MKKMFLAIPLSMAVSMAMAENDINWNYVSLSHHSVNVDGVAELGIDDSTFDGFGISGSALLSNNFFITGGYTELSGDILYFDGDIDTAAIGLGYRHSISNSTDIYGVVSYQHVNTKIDFGGYSESDSDNATEVDVGVRSMVSDSIELMGAINYVTGYGNSDTGETVSAVYHFNKSLGIGLEYSHFQDSYGFGVSGIWFF